MPNDCNQPENPAQGRNPPSSPPGYPPIPAYYVPLPVEEDDVNLLDYWRVLVRHKWLIIAVTFLCTVAAAAAAFRMTPVYRAEVLLAPVTEQGDQGGLTALASQFGGLASLAGIDLGGGGASKDEAIATLKSRAFTEQFIKDENLLPVLFHNKWDEKNGQWLVEDSGDIPTLWDAFALFDKKIRFVRENRKTGFVTLVIEWVDPVQAARWANLLVQRANTRLRKQAIEQAKKSIDYLNKELNKTTVVELQQAIYQLIQGQINKIMLANVRDEYAFKVIDPAVAPKKRIRPNRGQMVIIGLVVGLILGVIGAFFRDLLITRRARQSGLDGSSRFPADQVP